MSTKMLPLRIVLTAAAAVLCVVVALAAVVDDVAFGGAARRPVPAASRVEDRLSAGSWQMRSTDAVLDVAVAEVAWRASLHNARLGDLTGAAAALDHLAAATASLRTEIAGPLLHPDDQADRTDIHEGLALIESGIGTQRDALDRGDPTGYVAAAADTEAGLDQVVGTYGRGRR